MFIQCICPPPPHTHIHTHTGIVVRPRNMNVFQGQNIEFFCYCTPGLVTHNVIHMQNNLLNTPSTWIREGIKQSVFVHKSVCLSYQQHIYFVKQLQLYPAITWHCKNNTVHVPDMDKSGSILRISCFYH